MKMMIIPNYKFLGHHLINLIKLLTKLKVLETIKALVFRMLPDDDDRINKTIYIACYCCILLSFYSNILKIILLFNGNITISSE
jgi:hypothetical protein